MGAAVRFARALLDGLMHVVRAHPLATVYVIAALLVGFSGVERLQFAFYASAFVIYLGTMPLGLLLRTAYLASPEVVTSMGGRAFPTFLWPIGVFFAAQHPAMSTGVRTAKPARRFIGAFGGALLGLLALSAGNALR